MIDVAITPNRGDCLGVRGIARDLAAAGLGTLKPLDTAPVPGELRQPDRRAPRLRPPTPARLPVLRRPADPRRAATARARSGCRTGCWRSACGRSRRWSTSPTSSPSTSAGRCTSSTPTSSRGGLHVRLARDGETLAALNGKDYALTRTMTVIADDAGAAGAGRRHRRRADRLHAETTATSSSNRRCSIRCAPPRPAAALSIASDARYRFERGVDPAFVDRGLEIATRLILELCGGEASRRGDRRRATRRDRRRIAFRPARVRTLAGVDVPRRGVRRGS